MDHGGAGTFLVESFSRAERFSPVYLAEQEILLTLEFTYEYFKSINNLQ